MVEKDKKFCGINTQLAWYEVGGQKYRALYTTIIFAQEKAPSKSKEPERKFASRELQKEQIDAYSIAIR